MTEAIKHPKVNMVVSIGLIISTAGWLLTLGWFGAKYDGAIENNRNALGRNEVRFVSIENDISELQKIVAAQAVTNAKIDVTLSNISATLAQINRKLESQP